MMRVLLAVSGGIDSMYMLYRAPELFPGASYAVAHCNFCLRGAESDGDEEFVRQECKRLGIECFVNRFDTLGYASEHGVSVEMAARELRYGWFASLCADNSFDVLATAHNANDNAETLILNLLRGTGTKGLRGIPGDPGYTPLELPPEDFASLIRNLPLTKSAEPCGKTGDGDEGSALLGRSPQPAAETARTDVAESSVPADEPHGSAKWEGCSEAEVLGNKPRETKSPAVIRPLLKISRDEIREWMESNGRQWREDRTNAENEAKRNKIRNLVFPVFADINPSFIKTLGADMERIRQTDDIAEEYYQKAAASIVGQNPDGATLIGVPGLLALKHWRYVLWRILEDCSSNAETFDKLCSLLDRYRTEPLGTVTLSGKTFQSPSYILRARKKQLVLQARQSE